MEPTSGSIVVKNLQGYSNLTINLYPYTSVSSLIRSIAKYVGLSEAQIDIVTVTMEPGNPLSIINPSSKLPSSAELQFIIYYYFVKPIPMQITPLKFLPSSKPPDVSIVKPISGLIPLQLQPRSGLTHLSRPGPVPIGKPISRKGKEFETPPKTPPPLVVQPLPPTINMNVWQNPEFVRRLQLLSKTTSDIVIYYHSDQEKAILDSLLIPMDPASEEFGSSVPGPVADVRNDIFAFLGIEIPVRIWLVRSTGYEQIDPILTNKLPEYLTNAIKISLSYDGYAIQIAPADYSDQSKFNTSLLWLAVNPSPGMQSQGSSPEVPRGLSPPPTLSPLPPSYSRMSPIRWS
jgi:hypothetical protein